MFFSMSYHCWLSRNNVTIWQGPVSKILNLFSMKQPVTLSITCLASQVSSWGARSVLKTPHMIKLWYSAINLTQPRYSSRLMNRNPVPKTYSGATTPVCLTLTSLSILLVNDFFGYSQYVKPVTKTLASLGFLYLGVNYGLVNSAQGYYVFIGQSRWEFYTFFYTFYTF